MKCLARALAALLLASCGGETADPPPTPDLSGVWAGSWQGTDPQLGFVSGTWGVPINQGPSSASGSAALLGDVDCMDGSMQTTSASQTQVAGTLTRPGCPATINGPSPLILGPDASSSSVTLFALV